MIKYLMILIIVVTMGIGCSAKDRELVAFTNDSHVSGSFFLGCGYIGEIQVYHFLWKQEDGGIRQAHSEVSVSTVYEVDEKPHVVSWMNTVYDFYIPKGSVNRDFKLDLEK